MWNSGHYFDNGYNDEMICDIVSNSYEFINEIVEKYKKEGLKMACGGKKKGNGRRK